MKSLCTTAAVLALSGGQLLAQAPASLATIPETDTFEIHSEIVDADFQISVSFPFGYHQMADAQFPVLYLPDAWWTFGMATDIARVLSADQLIPPMLVVGIGYPGGLGDAIALRVRDMTFRQSAGVEQIIAQEVAAFGPHPPLTSGGADDFLRFLTEELAPRIERAYRGDPNQRVLHGHSLGGSFVVDAVFRRPEAFTHYIASAPALMIDVGVSFLNENEFAAATESVSVSLYVAVGLLDAPELVASVAALVDTLTVREYKGFRWEVSRLEGQTHRSVMPVVLRDGLRWIFRDSTR
ncbi:MAG: alpha/beta hydrolase-fold protein [Gemmatimonadetes bacterium]|nr:alpha/beta hydrolase-fold protein [Gemmatimonadota bacterium]